jgi:hypothetical protein
MSNITASTIKEIEGLMKIIEERQKMQPAMDKMQKTQRNELIMGSICLFFAGFFLFAFIISGAVLFASGSKTCPRVWNSNNRFAKTFDLNNNVSIIDISSFAFSNKMSLEVTTATSATANKTHEIDVYQNKVLIESLISPLRKISFKLLNRNNIEFVCEKCVIAPSSPNPVSINLTPLREKCSTALAGSILLMISLLCGLLFV